MLRICLLTIILFTVIVTPGLANDDEEFAERVRASRIVGDSESILLSSNVFFYPNKKGHSLLSGNKKRRTKAHIVFTENGFAVVSWSGRKDVYEVIFEKQYTELASSNVSGGSPFLRLVTETKENGRFDSFEIMDSKNSLAPNTEKTREANKLINAGIAGKDVKAAASVKDLSVLEVAEQKQRMQELEERIARLEAAGAGEEVENKSSSAECDCKCPPEN